MSSAQCKLHRRARAFIKNELDSANARRWLLSDDPTARQCGGCNPTKNPGECHIDRVAIQWAMAERWEMLYHQPHRPYSAEELLKELRLAMANE